MKLRFQAVVSRLVYRKPLLFHQFLEYSERHPEIRAAKRGLAATAKLVETARRVGSSWWRSGKWRKATPAFALTPLVNILWSIRSRALLQIAIFVVLPLLVLPLLLGQTGNKLKSAKDYSAHYHYHISNTHSHLLGNFVQFWEHRGP